MTDAALDLSSKSTATVAIKGATRYQFPSKFPLSSKRFNPRQCTSSSSSDDDNNSSVHYSAIKPVIGPITPTISVDTSASSTTVVPDIDEHSLPSSPSTTKSAGVSRPFNDYPVEPMTFAYSSSSSALMAGHIGALTSPLSVGFGLSSNFPYFPVTPLTSHLFQRKRRKESHSSSHSGPDNSDNDSRKLKNVPEEKDNSYWERRRKNNEAAKRSRDNRRQKEEEVAHRAAYLEQENLQLKAQVAMLKAESTNLHYMLFNRR